MRITKLLLICCLIAAPAVWGQAASSPAKPGILGYLDPHTGAFRPIGPAAEEDAELPAATTFTGTVTVTITITIKTTALTTFTCSGSVSAVDGTTSPVFFDETNTVAATGTGTTRTCKLSIPYSWSLTTQSTDNMTTTYSFFATAGTPGLPHHTTSPSPLAPPKFPPNSPTTPLTA